MLDWPPDTVRHLIECRPMFTPADPAGRKVEIGRLEAIKRLGEPRVRRLASLEFIPEGAHVAVLFDRQKPEYAIRRRTFRPRDGGAVGLSIDRGVAGVDLDQIVQQKHPRDP